MRIFNFLLTSSLILALASCYPKGPEFIDELDIALTDHNPDFNFGAQKTFYLVDSIRFITNDKSFQKPSRSIELDILNTVASNMTARNYVRIDSIADTLDFANPANPDFFITVTSISTTSSGVGYYPIGGWGGYWGWGWGWGYGGGWVPYSYSYTTGSAITDIGHFKGGDNAENTIPLQWTGGINGVAGSYQSSNVARVKSGIDQTFKQSPYILSVK
jgi:Domain of unknown function (DUF4136)